MVVDAPVRQEGTAKMRNRNDYMEDGIKAALYCQVPCPRL